MKGSPDRRGAFKLPGQQHHNQGKGDLALVKKAPFSTKHFPLKDLGDPEFLQGYNGTRARYFKRNLFLQN